MTIRNLDGDELRSETLADQDDLMFFIRHSRQVLGCDCDWDSCQKKEWKLDQCKYDFKNLRTNVRERFPVCQLKFSNPKSHA